MHYYQFNIGDYVKDTQHLSDMEDLAYRRMIDLYYRMEKALPDSIDDIARLIRMRTHSECIAVVLQEFFVRTEDGFENKRIEKELRGYKSKSEKARASAKSRWSKNKDLEDANALRTECDGNAKHKPITNNHKPILKDKASENFSPPDGLNLEAWNLWLEYRKQNKLKAYKQTKLGIGQQMNRLIELAGGNKQAQMDVVMQSINGNWQGLHELKSGFSKPSRNTLAEPCAPMNYIPDGFRG